MTRNRHAELDAAEHALSVAFVLARADRYRSGPRMQQLSAAEDRYRRARELHLEHVGLSAGPSASATIDLRRPTDVDGIGSGRPAAAAAGRGDRRR